MSTVAHFSPDLSVWISQSLDRGEPPAELVRIMIEQRMDPLVARAIVDAFVTARREQQPPPVDHIAIDESVPDYVYDASEAARPARIAAAGRTVSVLLHLERARLTLLAGVLDANECAELIELARPRLAASTVVNPYSGRDVVAAHRTSSGMFFRLQENAFIAELDRRIAEIMGLPLDHGEGFQVLHYPAGTETTPHFDFLQPTNDANRASIARSGQRVSTLIAYLNDVESGGETVFPRLGLSVPPQRGSAVYFEYANARGQVDELSLHGGNRVLAGEKWVLTKWMRQQRFVSASAAGAEGMLHD